LSGYSTAAIYKFFDSKQHLVTETLNRRADEYLSEVREAADGEGTPLERLHLNRRRRGRLFQRAEELQLAHQASPRGAAILGPVLAAFADDVYGRYGQAMGLYDDLVREGQKTGEIRAAIPARWLTRIGTHKRIRPGRPALHLRSFTPCSTAH